MKLVLWIHVEKTSTLLNEKLKMQQQTNAAQLTLPWRAGLPTMVTQLTCWAGSPSPS